MPTLEVLRIENAKHEYEIEVDMSGDGEYRHQYDHYILVCANNRTQAAAMARKAGYEVRSVNMTM